LNKISLLMPSPNHSKPLKAILQTTYPKLKCETVTNC